MGRESASKPSLAPCPAGVLPVCGDRVQGLSPLPASWVGSIEPPAPALAPSVGLLGVGCSGGLPCPTQPSLVWGSAHLCTHQGGHPTSQLWGAGKGRKIDPLPAPGTPLLWGVATEDPPAAHSGSATELEPPQGQLLPPASCHRCQALAGHAWQAGGLHQVAQIDLALYGPSPALPPGPPSMSCQSPATAAASRTHWATLGVSCQEAGLGQLHKGQDWPLLCITRFRAACCVLQDEPDDSGPLCQVSRMGMLHRGQDQALLCSGILQKSSTSGSRKDAACNPRGFMPSGRARLGCQGKTPCCSLIPCQTQQRAWIQDGSPFPLHQPAIPDTWGRQGSGTLQVWWARLSSEPLAGLGWTELRAHGEEPLSWQTSWVGLGLGWGSVSSPPALCR